MRVDIEQSHSDIYKSLVKDINRASRKLTVGSHRINQGYYQKLLFNTNLSVEIKKKELVKHLHKSIVKTFTINASKVSKKALIATLKNNLLVLRALVDKLRAINHYLEDSFLKDIGVIKKNSGISLLKSKNPQRLLLKKRHLLRKDLEKLDHTVYRLIEKVIFLDKKLLKGYKKKEEKIVKRKKFQTKDIENILKKESEILMHLEAKLPPAGKINSRLIKNNVLHNWIARIFALLSGFENEFHKESLIFQKLKSSEGMRKKINKKIKSILKEKQKLLGLKEKRALSMKRLSVDKEWRLTFHNFSNAAGL